MDQESDLRALCFFNELHFDLLILHPIYDYDFFFKNTSGEKNGNISLLNMYPNNYVLLIHN